MVDDEKNRGDRVFVPSWDGNPHGWRRYRDEVRIWRLSERTTGIDYSLAARLVQHLSGAARRAAMTLSDEERHGRADGR